MEKVDWQVEGMTCGNCALTISRFLQKEGMHEVKVNPLNGAVSFLKDGNADDKLIKGIETLGYSVKGREKDKNFKRSLLSDNKRRFLFCLPFTLVLMLHMAERWLPIHWLMDPWIQLALCIPVFLTGMWYFGRSAVKSIRNGMPNMNVLIALGALASFAYSLTGLLLQLGPQYHFFETTATIITLVFMGNYLEEASIGATQRAVKSLARSQKVMAHMIAFDEDHKEHIFPIENTQLKVGDLLLIKNGEQVPIDCRILWGECTVNEAIITGESTPIVKTKKDQLIGGSIIEQGIVKTQVTATGSDTVLSGILKMVQEAQGEKPPVQKLADKISGIFVPVVIGIAVISFIINFSVLHLPAGSALMRAVAVLVISCPCAMGLATPAAIAVGLGRAAKSGILFRNASSLESFKSIKQVVFDKTGTLTTGNFVIADYAAEINEVLFKKIVYSLEKFSGHPLGRSVAAAWKCNDPVKWKTIEEIKGLGIKGQDPEGNTFEAGSFRILPDGTANNDHNIYVLQNGKMIGWIDLEDEIREEAVTVIQWLHKKKIRTILLSGDRNEKCMAVGKKLGIDEVIAEQSPKQKLEKIGELTMISPTAMIGDGINDAPALAKATVGISLSDASHIVIQQADVILVNHGLKNLPAALGLGKHTYLTIKQNLFWAFLYNILAIPIAAAGLLTPGFAALAMGLSDVVLGANSIRLFIKKVL